jgi:hypothetical protein
MSIASASWAACRFCGVEYSMPMGTWLVMMEETLLIEDQTEMVTEGGRFIYIEAPEIEAVEKVETGEHL